MEDNPCRLVTVNVFMLTNSLLRLSHQILMFALVEDQTNNVDNICSEEGKVRTFPKRFGGAVAESGDTSSMSNCDS